MPIAPSPSQAELQVHVVPNIDAIPARDWNDCANNFNDLYATLKDTSQKLQSTHQDKSTLQEYRINPFISHSFLSSLERSKSVGRRTGWLPQHLVVKNEDGQILGVAPVYLKAHSRGEYVFDQGWAEAYEHAGGNYYPKLQVAVPFTPATGPRLMVRPSDHSHATQEALTGGLMALCHERQASSVHATFLPKAECDFLAGHGFLQRTDQQFHWENAGYATFADFLTALSSRKRKLIRRERRDSLTDSGITIHWLTGTDLTEDVWDAFFEFYMDTGSRKWGHPYLTRAFYSLIGEAMPKDILLIMAKRDGRWIAGAINFIGSDTLFGRHWGAIEQHPFLHFEICYYQAIEYAIMHKLARVEAGAQGEHKLARGYVPVTTYSAHYIADPALRRAVADYLQRERAYVDAASHELAAMTPFRKTMEAE